MKKIINFAFLFVFIVFLVGCTVGKGALTRVDVQKIDTEGNYEEVVIITDIGSIELLEEIFENVKWEHREVSMPRPSDVKTTLFYTFDENMPEMLVEYEIWFIENSGTALIIRNNEDKNYGELDKENVITLKTIFFN